ncbi:MAG: integrase arm-type DNA-binding domain-containing protein, partial [Acidobacteriota bacterium]
DTEIAGFGLRIYPTGRKSFLITYRAKGRQRFYTLGRFGELTVQQARAEALETLGRARKGADPSGARREARRAPKMEDLADRHIQDHAKIRNKPRSVKRDRRAWDRCVLPKLGKRRVKDINRADVARLMTEMAETPAMANKVLTLLSKAFNLAEIWGWRPEGSNPCRHVSRFKEESRDRYLSESELQRLGQVLEQAEHDWLMCPYAVAATLGGSRLRAEVSAVA